MRRRPAGSDQLEVSVAGLGCNNFGMRIDDERVARPSSTPRSTPASTTSTPPRATGREVGGVPRRGARQPPRRGGHHHQGRDGRARGEHGGSEACVTRRSTTASRASAPTTSTSTSCTSPIRRRRSRETLVGVRQARRRGQGARDRLLELLGATSSRRPRPRHGARRPAVRERAERLQPARTARPRPR